MNSCYRDSTTYTFCNNTFVKRYSIFKDNTQVYLFFLVINNYIPLSFSLAIFNKAYHKIQDPILPDFNKYMLLLAGFYSVRYLRVLWLYGKNKSYVTFSFCKVIQSVISMI